MDRFRNLRIKGYSRGIRGLLSGSSLAHSAGKVEGLQGGMGVEVVREVYVYWRLNWHPYPSRILYTQDFSHNTSFLFIYIYIL